jgi:hypothetical protein
VDTALPEPTGRGAFHRPLHSYADLEGFTDMFVVVCFCAICTNRDGIVLKFRNDFDEGLGLIFAWIDIWTLLNEPAVVLYSPPESLECFLGVMSATAHGQ